jgi:transmembrane sensor
MNAEQLLEKLIKNQITRVEFDRLLEGLDDEDILARYEMYLQSQFEKEIENHFSQTEKPVDETKSDLKITKKYSSKKKKAKVAKKKRNFPLAAAVILLIGLAFSLLFIISQFDEGSGQGQKVLAKTAFTPQNITKSTPRGRKFRMNLDDGSFVHMNSVSTIIYPNKFAENNREIEIEGEAYFEVQRDETRPFNIKVKDYSVEVLGTSFNIQAYEGEDEFSVTVESGTVKVNLGEHGKNSSTLEKDQKLIYNPTTNVTEIIDVKSDEEISWRKGILKFDATPMAKVEKTIERWYGIDLVVSNSNLYDKAITGIHKNENLKSVIETITYATGSEYTIKNNSIIIN